jgi:hypothetical protein
MLTVLFLCKFFSNNPNIGIYNRRTTPRTRSHFFDEFNIGRAKSITSYDVKRITYPGLQPTLSRRLDKHLSLQFH